MEQFLDGKKKIILIAIIILFVIIITTTFAMIIVTVNKEKNDNVQPEKKQEVVASYPEKCIEAGELIYEGELGNDIDKIEVVINTDGTILTAIDEDGNDIWEYKNPIKCSIVGVNNKKAYILGRKQLIVLDLMNGKLFNTASYTPEGVDGVYIAENNYVYLYSKEDSKITVLGDDDAIFKEVDCTSFKVKPLTSSESKDLVNIEYLKSGHSTLTAVQEILLADDSSEEEILLVYYDGQKIISFPLEKLIDSFKFTKDAIKLQKEYKTEKATRLIRKENATIQLKKKNSASINRLEVNLFTYDGASTLRFIAKNENGISVWQYVTDLFYSTVDFPVTSICNILNNKVYFYRYVESDSVANIIVLDLLTGANVATLKIKESMCIYEAVTDSSGYVYLYGQSASGEREKIYILDKEDKLIKEINLTNAEISLKPEQKENYIFTIDGLEAYLYEEMRHIEVTKQDGIEYLKVRINSSEKDIDKEYYVVPLEKLLDEKNKEIKKEDFTLQKT